MSASKLLPEAYDINGNILGMWLVFTEQGFKSNQPELYQNIPNPFNSHTAIDFSLPSNGTATIAIQDVSGRVVHSVSGEFGKGMNQLLLDRSKIPSAGIFFTIWNLKVFNLLEKWLW